MKIRTQGISIHKYEGNITLAKDNVGYVVGNESVEDITIRYLLSKIEVMECVIRRVARRGDAFGIEVSELLKGLEK